ncbi:uncharacterized protein K02A2.6-like isoform X3 [Photinus pyralis]|uniref:uncharacterized protein K02A2.6-like isoform X3 n=1 Tax=Photinus pyralis TaxID=7054 RepID=UPI001266F14C|nr:uncharacterized protein K02A2.6-like isoform X3 [Photinus pyralis]
MANLVGSIEQFDEKNKGDFVSYMERMEQFFLINDSLSTKQSALFITLAGPQVYSTLKNLIAPEDPTKKSFKEIKEALLKHYAPTKSETAERFEFYKATQNPEQSVSQFIMHIRKLANSCNFGSFLDQALRDKLVCGISSEQTQRRLLCEKDLTFSKACQMAIAIESAENQAKALKGGLVEKVTDHVSESSRRSVSSQWRPKGRGQPSMSSTSQPRQSGRGKCRHCGRFHDESRCRARDWKCFTCNRQGHTSVVCWKKNGVKCVNEEEQETSTEEDEINKISTLVCNNVKSVNSSALLKEMLVNDKPVLMEVDTGASVTVMSSEKFNKLFPLLTLAEHKAKLRGVSGQELNVLGQVIVDVKLSSQDKNVFRLPLIIIDNECRYTLLGRSWLDILYPDWKNCIANINPNVSELYVERFKKDFNTVFDVDRLSFIKDVRVKLVLKENAVPIFHAPYRIPYSIKEAVEMELKEMLESGVLEKTKYSEWASPIVVVPRKSMHYDVKKPIVIAVDASQYGVGAVMSHLSDGVEHPIMFASSTLSNREKNYAQIQKEALAIMFAVRKFHKYIYGRKFTLITDHLPLRTILNVKTGIPTLATSRLQRWALELSAYDYEIKYKKGNENANADFFSRLPSESILNEDVLSFSEFNEIPLSVTDVSMSTKKDKVIARVLEYTKKGWPDKLPDLGLKDYFSKRHELNIENECLLWGNRLVIPFDLREKVLEILHSQHIGIARMKMLARSEVWWPSMDLHIEEHVKRCEMCQLHQNKPIDVPYTPWSKTSKSWKRLHIDFLQFKQYHFLIVVDSHSKWLDIYLMKHGTDSSKTIEKLRQSFLHFGIPEEIVSDNGPPFSGEEYKKFCSSNGINCLLTPPLHACSNGLAEKNVQTVKQALRKSLLNPNNSTKSIQLILDNFIFKHRNTPSVSTGISPASIMLKQQPRTKLTMLKTKLSSTLKEREEKVKIYEDRRRTKLREFVENEKVLAYIIQGRKPVWMEGVVMQRVSAVTYLIKLNGNIRLMHADHLKKSYISENITLPYEDLPDILIPTAQEKPSEPLIAQPSTSVPKPTVQPSLPLSHPVPLRRSAREIKAPSKLNL